MTDLKAGTSTSRYEMQDRIATGGMGEVWRARDTVLGRTVAVKLLKPEYADDAVFRERFATEARNAASLHHPNIATVFDFGENESDEEHTRPYLVMELVDGKPLSELITPDRPMDHEQVRSLVRQAAKALAQAHAVGLVHRDVKPANLLVTPSGRVKVTDFGIARAADAVSLTSTGEVLGTPHYLSPEQAEGKLATPASDVYALGVVLFECLTGRRPFSADTPVATALAHLRSPVPELPADVPEDLAAITRRALAKDPDERYLDAGALASALVTPLVTPLGADVPGFTGIDATQAMAAGDQTQAMSPPTAVLTSAPADETRDRRLPPWWPLAALAVLGVILLVTAFLSRGGSANDPAAGPTGSPTGSTSVSPSSSPSANGPTLRASEFVGLDVKKVTDELHALGYDDVRSTTVSNPGDKVADTVSGISPVGAVATDRQITLTVWGEPAKATPPAHHKHHGKGKKK